MTDKRSDWLDVCRALAVIGVVAHHCGQVLEKHLPLIFRYIFQAGQYGVQLFFIVSSITICASLARADWSNDKAYRNFMVRRYFRIAPLYYTGIIFYGFIWWLATMQTGVTGFWHEYTLTSVIANVLFIHTFVPTGANNLIVPGGWSIGVEMVFYVIAPFIFRLTGTTRWLVVSLLVTWLGGSTLTALVQKALSGSYYIPNNSYFYFWFPSQAFIFLLGFLLYRYWGTIIVRDGSITARWGLIGLAGFGICYGMAIYFGMVLKTSSLLVLPIVALGMAGLVIGLGYIYRHIPGYKALVVIGRYSYSIYLTHFIIQMIFLFAGKRGLLVPPLVNFGGGLFAFLCVFLIVLMGSLIISIITKKHIEDRFINIGRRFIMY